MNLKITVLVASAAIALSACIAPKDEDAAMPSPTEPPPAASPCGAEDYASMIGTNIAAVTLPVDLFHRVLYPDTVATMDYREERLNFYVTKDGVIEDVRCG